MAQGGDVIFYKRRNIPRLRAQELPNNNMPYYRDRQKYFDCLRLSKIKIITLLYS